MTVSEKSSWKRGLRATRVIHCYTHLRYLRFREKLMKKRIERFSFFFGWEVALLFRFREKLMKKRIERSIGLGSNNVFRLLLFQRKAHEKEDWEYKHKNQYWEIKWCSVSEKSSWKRGLRAEVRTSAHSTHTSGFREKLMKKRIERIEILSMRPSPYCLPVSEKSSWKRGLRDRVSSTPWCGEYLCRFREKLMKKRIERLLSRFPPLSANLPLCFREKLMKKRIESALLQQKTLRASLPLFQRKAHEKEDWEEKGRWYYDLDRP